MHHGHEEQAHGQDDDHDTVEHGDARHDVVEDAHGHRADHDADHGAAAGNGGSPAEVLLPHAVDDESGHGAHAEAGREALDEAGGEHGRAAVGHHEHDAADDGEHEGEAGHGSTPEGVGDASGEQERQGHAGEVGEHRIGDIRRSEPDGGLVVGIEGNRDRRGGENGQKRDGGEREPAQGLPVGELLFVHPFLRMNEMCQPASWERISRKGG